MASQQESLLTERQAVIEKVEADNLNLRNELDTLKVEQGENKKKVYSLAYTGDLIQWKLILSIQIRFLSTNCEFDLCI